MESTVKDDERERVIKCPKCEKVLLGFFGGEMVGSDTDTGAVHYVRRYLRAECPKHGWFSVEIEGHHKTSDWELKECFPKLVRKAISEELSKEERRLFNEMMSGKRRTDWQLLKRWQSKIRPPH